MPLAFFIKNFSFSQAAIDNCDDRYYDTDNRYYLFLKDDTKRPLLKQVERIGAETDVSSPVESAR